MAVGRGSINRVANASNESKKDSAVDVGAEVKDIGSEDNKQKKRMFSLAEPSQCIDTLYEGGTSCFAEVKLSSINPVPASWIKKCTIERDITKLIQSIEKYGLLEPLVVRQTGDEIYQLLSGYARLEAMSSLKFETVVVKNAGVMDNILAKEIFAELHKNQDQKTDQDGINIHEQKFQMISSIKSELPSYLL